MTIGSMSAAREVALSFQLVSPSTLNDRAKTMIEFEAQYDQFLNLKS